MNGVDGRLADGYGIGMRKHRNDDVRVDGLDGNRAIMPFLMRGKNESAVYFEQTVDLTRTTAWLEGRSGNLFHLCLFAIARTLHEHPRLNRYVAGRRYYLRLRNIGHDSRGLKPRTV